MVKHQPSLNFAVLTVSKEMQSRENNGYFKTCLKKSFFFLLHDCLIHYSKVLSMKAKFKHLSLMFSLLFLNVLFRYKTKD